MKSFFVSQVKSKNRKEEEGYFFHICYFRTPSLMNQFISKVVCRVTLISAQMAWLDRGGTNLSQKINLK